MVINSSKSCQKSIDDRNHDQSSPGPAQQFSMTHWCCLRGTFLRLERCRTIAIADASSFSSTGAHPEFHFYFKSGTRYTPILPARVAGQTFHLKYTNLICGPT